MLIGTNDLCPFVPFSVSLTLAMTQNVKANHLLLIFRTHSVFVGHQPTPSVLKCGVPQGSDLWPLLFTLYTHPLSMGICLLGLSYTFFADHSQFHNSSVPSDFQVFAWCLIDCIEWMSDRKSTMNDDETELIAIGTRSKISQLIPNLTPVSICGCDIPFSQSVKYLGCLLNKKHSLWTHTLNTCVAFCSVSWAEFKNPLLPVHRCCQQTCCFSHTF